MFCNVVVTVVNNVVCGFTIKTFTVISSIDITRWYLT